MTPTSHRSNRGSLLLFILAITTVFGLIAVAVANYTATSLRYTSQIKERYFERSAMDAAARVVLDGLLTGDFTCPEAMTDVFTVDLNGTTATAACSRKRVAPGDYTHPAVVATASTGDRIIVGEDGAVILGDVYFPFPPTSLNRRLIVEDGDIWMGSTACSTTPPSPISRLILDSPDDRQYICAGQNWRTLFPPPSLPPPPPAAPAPITINGGTCRVYFPGSYNASFGNAFDTRPDTYLVSGVYHLNNVNEWLIRNTFVRAGRPGEAETATPDEAGWVPGCVDAAIHPDVNDTGAGVTFVLSGNSWIRMESGGFLELHQPVNGYSLIAYDVATGGYNASTRGTSRLVQTVATGHVRVHGKIWAPNNVVQLHALPQSSYTAGGVQAEEGALFGGIVVRQLELTRRPPYPEGEGGYNIQVPTDDPRYEVAIEVRSGTSSLSVAAQVRPTWSELAIQSWQLRPLQD
jgi:hypothetical protein